MSRYLIYIAVAVVVCRQAVSFPLDGKNTSGSVRPSQEVCNYKGRAHSDGDVINVDEPCLACRCRKGALTCGLRICPEVPDPPPKGCYIVHNANQCCPQLVCHVDEKETDIEVRTISGQKSPGDVCIVNGSLYAEGSALESTDKCEYCYCIKGQQKCIKPKCVTPFDGCKPIYTAKSCCPTQYDCRDQRTDLASKGKNHGCEMDGVAYAEGAMLSANDSNCETCYCMKGQVHCVSITCETESDGDCEPVYQSGRCCPTSYICSKTIMGIADNSITKRLDEARTDAEVGETTTEDAAVATITTEDPPETTTLMETATDIGLQKETTEEVTTPEVEESTVVLTSPSIATEARNRVNFNATEEPITPAPLLEEIYNSSPSHDEEDYDSYDYNEPRLPPSLPNLIIFPFVAADAVVKDEETTKSVTYDAGSIKRVGTEGPFYKDYFSPPTKTEGGFIPKDIYQDYTPKDGVFPRPDVVITVPPKTNSDQCIVKGRIREHGELISESGDCQSCICYYGDVICHEVTCPPLRQGCGRIPDPNSCCGKVTCDGNLPKPEITSNDPFRDVIRTEPAPDIPLLMGDLSPIYVEHHTKKPVTVTYKNLIVDYYPDFLVTTTRDDLRRKNYKNPVYITTEIQPLTVRPVPEAENVTYTTQPTVTNSIRDDLDGENSKYPYNDLELVRTSVRPIGTQPSRLFDYYTVEEYKPREQTTIRRKPGKKTTESSAVSDQQSTSSIKSTNSIKHKSTKTKSKATTTTARYKETQTKPDVTFSLDSVLRFFFDTETTTPMTTRKSTKKDGVKKYTQNPIRQTTATTTTTRGTATDYKYKENPADEEETPRRHQSDGKKKNTGIGGLLKLAGCNIYGRMYRVGKIITELSNPCLECLCTDFGVECNPLSC